MNRTAVVASLLAAALALPGCIVVGNTGSSDYRGHGSVEKAQFDSIVSANSQNRIGEGIDVVLGRYPAEHVSLVHAEQTAQGEVAVYRVYARERQRSTSFERYLEFRNGQLFRLTDDRDEVIGAGDDGD